MSKTHRLIIAAMACAFFAPLVVADELDSLIQQVEKGSKTKKSADDLAREQLISITTGPVDRRRIAMYEARIYVDSQPIIKALISSLQKDPPALASMAAIALGQMRVKDGIAPLTAALAHGSAYVRESAAYALAATGDDSVIPALEKARPEQPGLSRWVFDDAINTLRKGAPLPTVRPSSVNGAGVFFIGSSQNQDKLRDSWKPVIDRLNWRVSSIAPSDLNPQMGFYGGPIHYGPFSSMLTDKDGKPQIDVALVCNMGPDEFPFELQWQLFNFIRRGGSVVMLGDSMFSSGTVTAPDGKPVRTWSYIPELWQTALPKTIDKEFRPFRAGLREPKDLTTGVTTFGNGRVLMLRGRGGHQINTRGWDSAFLDAEHYENLVRYAIAGDEAFPTLIDLRQATESLEAGKPIAVSGALFSALGKTAAAGELNLELRRGYQLIASQKSAVDFAAGNLARLDARLPTEWRVPTGTYKLLVTFRRGDSSAKLERDVSIQSPLALNWSIENSFDTPGGELRGSAVIDSKLTAAIENASAIFELIDGTGRVLQRTSRAMAIKPGKNEAIPLLLLARDYRVDSYRAVLRIEVDGKTVELSQRLIHRTRPFKFDQDLIMAPFGGLDPEADPRNKEVMIAAGFNAIASRFGNPRPGWYNWSYDVAPKVLAKPVWPGDLAEMTNGGAWGLSMRRGEPGWNVIDHWDEGATKVLENEAGQDVSGADVFYRNWLKAKYRSLDKLNAAWASHFAAAIAKNPKDEKAKPEASEQNLTSWNQIQLRKGSPVDWHEADANFWWMTLDAERKEFRRTNRGHQLWHWSEVPHSRIYTTEVPGTLNWQQHEGRGALGNMPGSIMLHVIQPNKSWESYRRFPWAAFVGGARHLSVWCVSLSQTGTFGFNSGWTILNADHTVKDWWKPAAASVERARAKDQVLLDAWSSLSKDVAFLYCGDEASPRAFFDAIYFAGILPDSLKPGTLRSDRADLSGFKVIFKIGSAEIPASWRDRIDAWQKAGGALLVPPAAEIPRYGGREVTAEKGIKYWVASDMGRLTSSAFAEYQAKVLALLAERGVKPVAMMVDDAGLPAPVAEPALIETHDQSQFYLLAVGDSDIVGTQTFGALNARAEMQKIDVASGFYEGAKFSAPAQGTYRVWMQTSADKPFDTRVAVDGKTIVYSRLHETFDWLTTERGAGKQRWVAGPAISLAQGEHTIKLEHREPSTSITRVCLLDRPMIEPTIKVGAIGQSPVKSVYDVYNDRMLEPAGAGAFRAPMRQSDGHLYSLITEELAPLKVSARVEQSASDRVLLVKIDIAKKDGSASECRHSVFVDAVDAAGKPVPGARVKSSVLGWRVVSIFPSVDDSVKDWKIRVKDLTTGAAAEVAVAADSASDWAVREPLPVIELKTDLDPMALVGQIHFVPMRVRVVNNSDKVLEGKIKLDMPPAFLLEGNIEQPVRVEPKKTALVTWPMVLGREKALPHGMTQAPPRCWLTASDGRVWSATLESMWIREWEKQPPRVSDMSASHVEITVLNFLDKPVSADITPTFSPHWDVTKAPAKTLEIPAGNSENPGIAKLPFEARIQPAAPQAPEIFAMPMSITVGGKTIDAGRMLVEVGKERTWFVGQQRGMEGVDSLKAEKPVREPIDAKKERLWSFDWSACTTDSMINFASEFGKPTFGVTNVRFAQAGKVSVRVRSQEDVDVWVAGRAMDLGDTGREKPKAKGSAADELSLTTEKTIDVTAGAWMPVVVRIRKQTANPLSDLVFLDESGKVIWSAEFRASPTAP